MTDEAKYQLKFKTSNSSDAGTDNDVFVTLYDINMVPIGGEFEVSRALSKKYGNALKKGSFQVDDYIVPLAQLQDGKCPFVLGVKIRISGDDLWLLERMSVVPQVGWFNEPAEWTFVFNQYFSTGDEEYGAKSEASMLIVGYDPQTVPNSVKTKIETHFVGVIANNARGTSTLLTAKSERHLTDMGSVTFSSREGREKSNEIEVAVESVLESSGPLGSGVSTSISTRFQQSWREWQEETNTRAFQHMDQRSVTIPAQEVPERTIRIRYWDVEVPRQKMTLTNGIGGYVDLSLIPESRVNDIHVFPDPTVVDINSSNPITHELWEELVGRLRGSESANQIENARRDVEELGWFK